jgi:hypothetical protein
MKFWIITLSAVVISTGSMLAGSYIHARAVDEGNAHNRPVQLDQLLYERTADSKDKIIILSPELRDALVNEIQSQIQGPIMNAVIVITPQGEVRYLGTKKNAQAAELLNRPPPPDEQGPAHGDGPGPGGRTLRYRQDNGEN